jgi:UDP-galactopyranose mutase
LLFERIPAANYSTLPVHNPTNAIHLLRDHALICLSHLRWDLVFQRPQHLMTRFAQTMPVYFVEDPAFEGDSPPYLARRQVAKNLTVIVPHMPFGLPCADAASEQKRLLADFFLRAGVSAPVLWFYTPVALEFADALPAAVTIYDCMDELSAFQDASAELNRLEAALLDRADVLFTGGMSLYEAKRERHHNVHAFPSAVDVAHFGQARNRLPDPPDQTAIPHPRLGFFGVIDERLDRDLVAAVARQRPDWQLILVGPVVKIDPESLPRAPNIHYLGGKKYDDLPRYIANWDAAMMPFARNEATRFISPTKTPEYLAAGRPLVSTPIVDVVRGWGHLEAVRIAATPAQFVSEGAIALSLSDRAPGWLQAADSELEQISWDRTWGRMTELIAEALSRRGTGATAVAPYSAAPVKEPAVQFENGDARV